MAVVIIITIIIIVFISNININIINTNITVITIVNIVIMISSTNIGTIVVGVVVVNTSIVAFNIAVTTTIGTGSPWRGTGTASADRACVSPRPWKRRVRGELFRALGLGFVRLRGLSCGGSGFTGFSWVQRGL